MKACCRVALLAVIVGGCVDTTFEVELTPLGDSLDRKLTVHRRSSSDSDEPDDELKRLAREYEVEPPNPAKQQTFRFQGRFAGRMPGDVGGYGTFTRWVTPLGSVLIYVERFRGNDDAAGELKRREAAADRLADLLVGWFEIELKDEPAWPAIRRFLNEDVRRDLCNLGIYAWTLGLGPPAHDQNLPEPLVRAAQYLVERNYLTYDELPAISRLLSDSAHDKDEHLLQWLKRIIMQHVPDDAQRPELDFLATPERFSGTLRGYLETTEEYAGLQREWQAKRMEDPEAAKPDANEIPGRCVERLFAGALRFDDYDEATVVLNTAKPAIFSNGSWSAESGQVKWPKQAIPTEISVPAIAYAAWDEPDEANQKGSFGRIVLHGETLLQYCLWYRGLNDRERQEWDTFLRTLRPGSELIGKLKEFRFSHEPVEAEGTQRLAGRVVNDIVRELKRGS